MISTLIFILVDFYLKGRVSKRRGTKTHTERCRDYGLVLATGDHNSQNRVRTKPGAKNYI